MKKKRILGLTAGCLLAAAGSFCLLFQVAGGQVLPRNAQSLNLTDREISLEQFQQIRQAMPESDILWSVPFQGREVASDVRELTLDTLDGEDLTLLSLFSDLETLHVQEPLDYPGLLAFAADNPNCTVTYGVSLGNQQWDSTQKAITVADASLEELQNLLALLPNVEEVSLTGTLPDAQALLTLTESAPQVAFHWSVTLGDMAFTEGTEELIYTGEPCPGADVVTILKSLPRLNYADLRQCGISDETMFALCREFPEVLFLWEVPIGESRFPSDLTELDISGTPFETAQQVEDLLPCFPNLERVIMSHCGLDDETMDALNRKYEDIRFVWSVKIKDVYIRTDTTYFYPFKCYRSMTVNDADIYPLRYCTDIVAIDIGHMGEVTNCEWVRFMPNLKYLVLVETAITDISPLATCKNLVFLEIFTTAISDYTPLLECTALEDLNLGKTYGDPNIIAQMTWLKHVWWSGVDGTVGNPASNARAILEEALPNTVMKFRLETPNVDNGWRQLQNYYDMRDIMEVFYLT